MPVVDSSNVTAAFSEDQVQRLTGVSKRQLRYWDRTGFFKPSLASKNTRMAFSRIYSFKDVVSLRVIHVLRNQYNVPLQHLRKVAEKLNQLSDQGWAATELFVLDRRVIFAEPGTEKHREVVTGQYVLGLPLRKVVSDTRRDVAELNRRGVDEIGRIERRRHVGNNALLIAGTRIPVRAIKEFAEAGYGIEDILNEYPTLLRQDIEAAIRHKDDRKVA